MYAHIKYENDLLTSKFHHIKLLHIIFTIHNEYTASLQV